ncbi:MAG: DEAD/DEAH box helicase family protein [Gammaproteobacteria bacterium]|nr:DEAD/DEAH box helicase family protein [Gammaproteobacteria bacterium]
MSDQFFKKPILNSPYEYPTAHWELDESGQPTQKTVNTRRRAEFITPIPKPRKRKGPVEQAQMDLGSAIGPDGDSQRYDPTPIINQLRSHVDEWRKLKNPNNWMVTPETARLLQHWRHHKFSEIRPFFCQIEAVEVAIWLTEVAPKMGKAGKIFLNHLDSANNDANPDLMRLALKLATGAGKTTVMAMIIAWQIINAVRRSNSKKYSRGFLIVAPGLTIKDRLRVLLPNDPDSYYASRELVPKDMLPDLEKAKIVITNYHAFKRRERIDISKGGRSLLQGRGEALNTLETEGQMLQRVMPALMGIKNIMVINDEAHHCYREKPESAEANELKGDDKKEAEKNSEAARLWISGLEAVKRKIGVSRVLDLSATPFFLQGSGYAEGTLFPWTMSDFSLMDAIECGIVKLPRVPIADNIPGGEMPKFRNLWDHIRTKMPKKGRGKAKNIDPLKLPLELITALDALYGHYKKTFDLWQSSGIKVPPCFILVCNNTATSKLVYDYISGFFQTDADGNTQLVDGRLELFRNFDANGERYARPYTLLIDSEQLESGEALDKNFREMAADELERYRKEVIERTGDIKQAESITDQELLREVMNTVGKEGRLGETVRCVVSVSMLTEGWDTNTVTHVLGVRAFGTQLLCEQVIGRALRRQSYTLNDDGKFDVEYADVLGIPFDFNAKPVVAPPQRPRETIQVKAVRPERDHLEIRFPRVEGYRVELPEDKLEAEFNDDSALILTPELTGPSRVQQSGIIGETIDLTVEHLGDLRRSSLVFYLATHIIYKKWREQGQPPRTNLFGPVKRIVKQWLDNYLKCESGTYPAQLMYLELAEMACEKITAAITQAESKKERPIKAILDAYNPVGSTQHVSFNTSKTERWETDSRRCHINWVVLDSDWEAEFCRVVEGHPQVKAYVKNHNLGLEVPYQYGSISRTYIPDFIVLVDDGQGSSNVAGARDGGSDRGHGDNNLLHLIVEIKGYRREDAKVKKTTMDTYWVPGVNHLKKYGRWAFAEFGDVFQMESDFGEKIAAEFDRLMTAQTNKEGI